MYEPWFWIFNTAIIILLTLDLTIFHKKSHKVPIKEALLMSAFWVALSLSFNVFVYFTSGKEAALNFFTGYLVEKSLSLDNLFVFLLIFKYFEVPQKLLHKVLFWGIFGAILMRAVLILSGISLLQNFHSILYVFGAFLLFTGFKLLFEQNEKIDPSKNILIRLLKKIIPFTHEYVEDKFFIKKGTKYFATPLFLVLITIETSDLIFAIDSIPAILGITTDFFIVYTSNIFAILGLRSLFFALSHSLQLFKYLHYGLALILIFIGLKMLISGYIEIPIVLSLGIILSILGVSIGASLKKA